MEFIDIHQFWAWVMIISNAVAGVWALAAHRSPSFRQRSLWWLTAFAQVTVAVQAILGVLVLNVDGREVDQLHVVYGFVALASVGILYSYQQQLEHWRFLLYGCGGLFLMGMGLRGVFL